MASQDSVVLPRLGTTRLFVRTVKSDTSGEDVTAAYAGQTRAIQVVARRNVVVMGSVSIAGPPMLCTGSAYLRYYLTLYLDGSEQALPVTYSRGSCGVSRSTATLTYAPSSLNTQTDPTVTPGRHALRARVFLSTSLPSVEVVSTADSYVTLMDRDTWEAVARIPLEALPARGGPGESRVDLVWSLDVAAYE